MVPKHESIIFIHFGKPGKKIAKKRPKNPKIVKIVNFCLVANDKPKKLTASQAIGKFLLEGMKNDHGTSVKKYKSRTHKVTTS